MNYRVVAERGTDGRVQLKFDGTVISADELGAALGILGATISDVSARQGAESLCATANIGTHVVQLSETDYAVPAGLPEIKALIGAEAFARALAAGQLACPYGTVNRDSISEDEMNNLSKMTPKVLVGGDALSDLRFADEVNKALAARGLRARLATKDEGVKTGRQLRANGVKFHQSYHGWFRTLDDNGQPVEDLTTILSSRELKKRLGYFLIDYDDWYVGYGPQLRFADGGLLLVVSKAK